MKDLNVFSLLFWILNVWMILVVVKWGARLFLHEVGVDLDGLARRLRRKSEITTGAIVKKTAYFIGSIADARHEIVVAADEDEAKCIGAEALHIPESHLTVTAVHDTVVARPLRDAT